MDLVGDMWNLEVSDDRLPDFFVSGGTSQGHMTRLTPTVCLLLLIMSQSQTITAPPLSAGMIAMSLRLRNDSSAS